MTQSYNLFHIIALKHSPEIQSSYLDYCDANQLPLAFWLLPGQVSGIISDHI